MTTHLDEQSLAAETILQEHDMTEPDDDGYRAARRDWAAAMSVQDAAAAVVAREALDDHFSRCSVDVQYCGTCAAGEGDSYEGVYDAADAGAVRLRDGDDAEREVALAHARVQAGTAGGEDSQWDDGAGAYADDTTSSIGHWAAEDVR